jgi:hypothetical protein
MIAAKTAMPTAAMNDAMTAGMVARTVTSALNVVSEVSEAKPTAEGGSRGRCTRPGPLLGPLSSAPKPFCRQRLRFNLIRVFLFNQGKIRPCFSKAFFDRSFQAPVEWPIHRL